MDTAQVSMGLKWMQDVKRDQNRWQTAFEKAHSRSLLTAVLLFAAAELTD